MLLKYAEKRIGFTNKGMRLRMNLAAIDHNMHHNRPLLYTKEGQQCIAKRYSKRSKNYSAHPLKEEKSYSYVPALLEDIMRQRAEKPLGAATFLPNDPKDIFPTIACLTPSKIPPKVQVIQKTVDRKRMYEKINI